jgi:hypothetical protein
MRESSVSEAPLSFERRVGAAVSLATLQAWRRERTWVLVAAAVLLASGMAYTLWWAPVVYHVNEWLTPPDLWATFRDAHYVGWGSEGTVYDANTSFVTFPGIAVLFAPLAMLQSGLHLSQSFPWYLAKPTAWYILGPADMLCGAGILFPLDAVARRLGATRGQRIALTWLEAALVWPCVALWGHPEDPLALAFALAGLLAAHDRSWFRTGAFVGLAIVFQPLTLLVAPLAFAYVPKPRWISVAWLAALPSALLLLAPLIQQWGPTTTALLKQPNDPLLNHPTPWLSLAPVLSARHWITVNAVHVKTLASGKKVLTTVSTRVLTGEIVASGPGRLVTLIGAFAIGYWAYRKRPALIHVAWLASLALALRCVFETVLDPYYFYPALALALVAAVPATRGRFALVVLAGAACTRLTYSHFGPWPYYLSTIGTLAVALILAYPSSNDVTLESSSHSNPQRGDVVSPTST